MQAIGLQNNAETTNCVFITEFALNFVSIVVEKRIVDLKRGGNDRKQVQERE